MSFRPSRIVLGVAEQQNLGSCDYLQGWQSKNSESAWGCYTKINTRNQPCHWDWYLKTQQWVCEL